MLQLYLHGVKCHLNTTKSTQRKFISSFQEQKPYWNYSAFMNIKNFLRFNESCKLLSTLCFSKSIRPSSNQVRHLIVMVLRRLKALFGVGLINFKMLFLNTNKICEFTIPKIPNSIMPDKSKKFLTEFYLMLY